MNSFDFLPEDYISPKSTGYYMKIEDGENKIRILSRPVVGWEDWCEKKPVRFKYNEKPQKPFDAEKPIKHFWAMIVWNYVDEEIQILHITQASIRKAIEEFYKDEDWGAPFFYDLKITKKGEKLKTEYSVIALPHKELKADVKEKFNERRCNLEALFDNLDPFSKEWTNYTPGIFTRDEVQPVQKAKVTPMGKSTCTAKEAVELEELLKECSEEYRNKVNGFMEKHNLASLYDLPVESYVKIRANAISDIKM